MKGNAFVLATYNTDKDYFTQIKTPLTHKTCSKSPKLDFIVNKLKIFEILGIQCVSKNDCFNENNNFKNFYEASIK